MAKVAGDKMSASAQYVTARKLDSMIHYNSRIIYKEATNIVLSKAFEAFVFGVEHDGLGLHYYGEMRSTVDECKSLGALVFHIII